jgi:hypothetical protein
MQNLQQIRRAQGNGISIAQEYLLQMSIIRLRHVDIFQNVFQRSHSVLFVLKHPAKRAGIVGTAYGDLKNIALPFTWGSVNVSFIPHKMNLL